MKICPNCGSEADNNANVCPFCECVLSDAEDSNGEFSDNDFAEGNGLIICPNCSMEVSSGTAVCPFCSYNFGGDVSAEYHYEEYAKPNTSAEKSSINVQMHNDTQTAKSPEKSTNKLYVIILIIMITAILIAGGIIAYILLTNNNDNSNNTNLKTAVVTTEAQTTEVETTDITTTITTETTSTETTTVTAKATTTTTVEVTEAKPYVNASIKVSRSSISEGREYNLYVDGDFSYVEVSYYTQGFTGDDSEHTTSGSSSPIYLTAGSVYKSVTAYVTPYNENGVAGETVSCTGYSSDAETVDYVSVDDRKGQINCHGGTVSGVTTDYVLGGQYETVRNSLGDTWHVTAKNYCENYGTGWYELWDSDDGDYYGWVDANYIDFY